MKCKQSAEDLEPRLLLTAFVADLAESNAAEWATFAGEGAATTLTDSSDHVRSGTASLRFRSESGHETGLAWPATADANLQLSDNHRLEFHVRSENPNIGWQAFFQPRVSLVTPTGTAVYTPTADQIPLNGDAFMVIPLSGDSVWLREDTGEPHLTDVDQIRFSHDTWDTGFTLHYDGVRLQAPGGADFASAHAYRANLLRNPGFELPAINVTDVPDPTDQIIVLSAGTPSIRHWEIFETDAPGTIDWVFETPIDASEGLRSVDLNGTPGQAGIQQTVATVPGVQYDLTFDMGGNPAGAFLPAADDPVKVLEVSAGGSRQQFDVELPPNPFANDAHWQTKSWSFVATDYETTLSFAGIGPTGSLYGAMLDNVLLTVSSSLVENGSFESFNSANRDTENPPSRDEAIVVLPEGSTAIAGWEIIAGEPGATTDWVHSEVWDATDGDRSIDLNGTPGLGGIRQDISTEIGRPYRLTFDLAGNPSGRLVEPASDPNKTVRVSINGAPQQLQFVVNPNTPLNNPHWQQTTLTFVATTARTSLEFLSIGPQGQTDPQDFGTIIDNVRVELDENLITNGSFEIPGDLTQVTQPTSPAEAPHPANPIYHAFNDAIADWQIVAGGAGGGSISFGIAWHDSTSVTASADRQSVHLDNGSAIQQFANTVPGHEYLLSYDISAAPGGVERHSGALLVGDEIIPIDYSGGPTASAQFPRWISHDHVFTATSNSTKIGFRGSNGDLLVDNVRLVSLDYGDAPASYSTLHADNGARHVPRGPVLGALRDSEPDARIATGNSTDEDGIIIPSLLAGTTTNITVILTNAEERSFEQPFPAGTFLNGWIDFNNDGDWDDAGEHVANNWSLLRAGQNSVPITVPANISATSAVARFRLSTQLGLGPSGFAPDGEVEAYVVSLVPPGSVSGMVWNDINGNGVRDIVTVAGTQPDIVFVVDTSGSADYTFDAANPLGDINGDGTANTRLDAEVLAFELLMQQLVDQGFGDTADVAVVEFNTAAEVLDLDPTATGVQNFVTPNTDADNDGVPDAIQRVRQLTAGGGTNFDPPIQEAIRLFDLQNTAATDGNVVFLSDGEGSLDRNNANSLRSRVVNVRAFGVSGAASETRLQQIDPGATNFTSAADLRDAFTGANNNDTFLEPGLPDRNVFIDRNGNGVLDAGDIVATTIDDVSATPEDEAGTYIFENLAVGSYTIRQKLPDDWRETHPGVGGLQQPHLVTVASGQSVTGIDFGTQVAPDRQPGDFVVFGTHDSGAGSLRQAIIDANTATEPARILFEIPLTDSGFMDVDSAIAGGDADPDAFHIQPLSPLPFLSNVNGHAIEVNAGSQVTFTGETNDFGPEIVLDGSQLSGGAVGLGISGPDVTIRGFNVHSFPNVGISVVNPATGARIAGNFIGTDPTGTSALPNNGVAGVAFSDATNSLLGGPDVSDRNVISGNAVLGVEVSVSASNITLQNNFIGTDATGTAAVPNGTAGIQIVNSNNIAVGANGIGNVVSGNDQGGLWVLSNSSLVEVADNIFGLDVSGIQDLPNNGSGILIHHSSNVSVSDNVVANALGPGIGTFNAMDLNFTGNLIGTTADGNTSARNTNHGLELRRTTNAVVGGTGPDEGNLISGNGGSGLLIFDASTNIEVLGNQIGTNISGDQAIANAGSGIRIDSSSNVNIGGSQANAGNLISGNLGNGILVHNNSSSVNVGDPNALDANVITSNVGDGIHVSDSSMVSIRLNNITDNGGEGIDLSPHGPTPNDNLDQDTGANQLQNHPVLESVTHSANDAIIAGSLHSTPNETFDIDVYTNVVNAAADAEGRTHLGSVQVSSDAAGNASFTLRTTLAAPGEFLTATATDQSGNTSEFSVALLVAAPQTDLLATNFDAINDDLPNGMTDVVFTIANNGNSASPNFATHIVWSADNKVGNADDIVVDGSTIAIQSLVPGAAKTENVTLQLPLQALNAHSDLAAPGGNGVGYVASDTSRLFLIVDPQNSVEEMDESNNSGRGHQIDSDDVSYFPWDANDDKAVTPRDALNVITKIGTSGPAGDFDGNGTVTPLEALSVIQRIGYVRDESAIEVTNAGLLAVGKSELGLQAETEAPVVSAALRGVSRSLFDDRKENDYAQTVQPAERHDHEMTDQSFEEGVDWLSII